MKILDTFLQERKKAVQCKKKKTLQIMIIKVLVNQPKHRNRNQNKNPEIILTTLKN